MYRPLRVISTYEVVQYVQYSVVHVQTVLLYIREVVSKQKSKGPHSIGAKNSAIQNVWIILRPKCPVMDNTAAGLEYSFLLITVSGGALTFYLGGGA